jgi:hypothetical protein
MFVLVDGLHGESAGQFTSLREAVGEVRRLASIAWDAEPNRAPCMSWRTCGRAYEIIEVDDRVRLWVEGRRLPILFIKAEGLRWAEGFEPDPWAVQE